MKKRALVTGINGMDGSHLADLLLEKDYEVFGLERRSSVKNRSATASYTSSGPRRRLPRAAVRGVAIAVSS